MFDTCVMETMLFLLLFVATRGVCTGTNTESGREIIPELLLTLVLLLLLLLRFLFDDDDDEGVVVAAVGVI